MRIVVVVRLDALFQFLLSPSDAAENPYVQSVTCTALQRVDLISLLAIAGRLTR
jgi:hypothetical protein